MTRVLFMSGLVVSLVLLSACSGSSNRFDRAPMRTYAADASAVIDATLRALDEEQLNVDEQGWADDDAEYVIRAFELDRVFQGAEGVVRTGTIVITVQEVASSVTEVRIVTTQRETSAMASSADRRPNHDRRLFRRLDDALPRAAETETP
ncbi:MAG: hypothetical protein AAGI71_07315 [Bacteroidota bacterium]